MARREISQYLCLLATSPESGVEKYIQEKTRADQVLKARTKRARVTQLTTFLNGDQNPDLLNPGPVFFPIPY